MDIGPIWRALMRSKSSYLLIALQIAVTMAIIVNAIAIIQERAALMARPSGTDENNIFHFGSQWFKPDEHYQSLIERDLAIIRNTPGVVDAIATNSTPLRNGGWSMSLSVEPGEGHNGTGTAIYFGDDHSVNTFGTNLIAGRNFRPDETSWNDPSISAWPPYGIITRAIAETMFPGPVDNVVGKTVYINDDNPVQIVGIMDRLQAPWTGWDGVERSMLVPQTRTDSFTRYVVRTEPGQRDRLMPLIEKALADADRDRIVDGFRTMDETRTRAYGDESALIRLLTFTSVLLTVITALGIVGLVSFNVSRRTRQIGTRRALGATRADILRYFLLENFLVSSLGIFAGAVLAVGLNMWMVQAFDIARISWYLVPAAMLLLWVVGQVATAGPARRASLVPPAVATRAV